ncbi:hypothetical protein H0H92_007352 [Tricholoma furcatifolium]|nr:hypothetical protein H0H92_007352 [Tricholoma furcatifolium]
MYEAAPRGLPMAPAEVSALAKIATGKRRDATDMDRVYAHRMLEEFDRITKAVRRDMRDRSMQTIRTTKEWRYNIPPNCPDCPAWRRVTWDISRSAQTSRDLTGKTRGAGLTMVEGKHALNITKWCQYIMHHCYPGSPNVFSGAAMDLSLRVDRRSVFGMLLCRALAPHKGRNHFIRQFAMTVTSPGLYREAIRDYNDRFPSEPFEPLPLTPGATIRLRKLKASLSQVKNLGRDDVLRLLLLNCILLDWVDHAYTYSVVYMDYHYSASDVMRDSYVEVDRERHHRLDYYGEPPSIPAWDGWFDPSALDRERFRVLYEIQASSGKEALDDPAWYSYNFNNRFSITYLRARGPAEVKNDPPPPVHLTRIFYASGKTPRASQPASQQTAASGSSGPCGVTGVNESLAARNALGASAGASSQTKSSRPLESGPLPVPDAEIEMAEASALSPPSAVNAASQSNMDWEHQQGHDSDGSRRSTGRRRSM